MRNSADLSLQVCGGSGYEHPASLPTPETTPDVEEYPMSNSADLSMYVCGGIGSEHPTSIQLSKAAHRTVDGKETSDSTQPTVLVAGCTGSKRAQAGLDTLEGLMIDILGMIQRNAELIPHATAAFQEVHAWRG